MSTPPAGVEMSAALRPGAPPPRWPEGIRPATWRAGDAPAVHAVLVAAYRDGGGTVGSFAEWAPWFTGDAEFDPETCFLARRGDGAVAGVCLCWSSGFVKDLCVAPGERRQGLGEALMRTALEAFRARGHHEVRLKVEAGNATAIRLYERLGFTVAG